MDHRDLVQCATEILQQILNFTNIVFEMCYNSISNFAIGNDGENKNFRPLNTFHVKSQLIQKMCVYESGKNGSNWTAGEQFEHEKLQRKIHQVTIWENCNSRKKENTHMNG